MYKSENYSGFSIYLCFVHLLKYEVNHLQILSSDEKWAVGQMQPKLLFCEVISLVIGIYQSLLTR